MSDNTKQLIEKAKQGDNIAISELMNQYNSELFNLAKMYSSSDSDAEDALQNTYIRAFRNLSSLEDINKFDSWIKQITTEEAQRINKTSTKPKVSTHSQTAAETTKPLQRRFDPMTGKPIGDNKGISTIDNTSDMTHTNLHKQSILPKILLSLAIIIVGFVGGYFVFNKSFPSLGIIDSAFVGEQETNGPIHVVLLTADGKEYDLDNPNIEYSSNNIKLINTWNIGDEFSIVISEFCTFEDGKVYKKLNESYYSCDGLLKEWNETEYDAAGNEIKYTSYNSLGEITTSFEYELDSKGNRLKTISYDLDGNVTWWRENEYDLNGKQIKSISYNSDGNVSGWSEYEYDSNGKQIKSISYNSDGNVSGWSEYEYDLNGKQIKNMSYDSNGNISNWSEYEYDSNGRQIKTIFYNADGSISSLSESEYDSMGRQLKYVSNNMGKESELIEERFYDDNGLNYSHESYSVRGEVMRRCVREFEEEYTITTFYEGNDRIKSWMIQGRDKDLINNKIEQLLSEHSYETSFDRNEERINKWIEDERIETVELEGFLYDVSKENDIFTKEDIDGYRIYENKIVLSARRSALLSLLVFKKGTEVYSIPKKTSEVIRVVDKEYDDGFEANITGYATFTYFDGTNVWVNCSIKDSEKWDHGWVNLDECESPKLFEESGD